MLPTRFLILIIALCLLAAPSHAATFGLFGYKDHGTSITITSFPNNTSGAVVIPDKILGKPVTSIGDWAFIECKALTSVIIPNSVTSIGIFAFYRCRSLTSVSISNNLKSIGDETFEGCTGLTSVIIPNSVTDIGFGAFLECSGLTSVVIPKNVTSIGSVAFWNCSGLGALIVDPANTKYTSIDGVLFNKPATKLLYFPATKGGSYSIPDSVTYIEYNAFSKCSLTSVDIGNNVTFISEMAFFGCSGLTSLSIPNSITSIERNTFEGCSGLTSLSIPDSVTTIGYAAFYKCRGLTSVTIPSSVTTIESMAFNQCRRLTDFFVEAGNPKYTSKNGVLFDKTTTQLLLFPGGRRGDYDIPNYVTYIGYGAFSDCNKLTSVTIPSSVTDMGAHAFGNCSELTSASIPNSFTSIQTSAFYNCTRLTQVNIPKSVTSISTGAFDGCRGLTSINIPKSVTSIGWYAFNSCSGLTSVTIPSNVTTIGERAFSGCSGLTSVIIPNRVTFISFSAFDECSSLTSAQFLGDAPGIRDGAFSYVASGFTVYFTEGRAGFRVPYWKGYPAVALPAVSDIAVQCPLGSDLTDGAAKKSFGTVKVGSTSSARTFTVLNTGTQPLTGMTVKIDDSNAADFSASPLEITRLPPGGSTTFKVTFKPSAAGTRKAAIHIKSNDSDETPFDIMLAGMGAN